LVQRLQIRKEAGGHQLSFWKPPRNNRLSPKFKLFAGVLYLSVFPIAFLVMHYLRLHSLRVYGDNMGYASEWEMQQLWQCRL
jgi:hypothetical protein